MTPSGTAEAPAPVAAAAVPFTQASHEYTEPFWDQSYVIGANQQAVGPVNVPANGYLANIFLEVSMSGGTLGAGVLNADYPFCLLQNITLSDVNGAPIYGPLDGYATLWTNIQSGVAFRSDPRQVPAYDGTINGKFSLRIPVQISKHDALGCLANQSASAAYQVNFYTATTAQAFSSAPTTPPTMRVKMALEAWTLPNVQDRAGRPQAQMPPAHGTTMFHSQNIKPIAVGANTTQLLRMGNLIRYHLIISRNAAGARVDTVFPDPVIFSWDARQITNDTQWYRRQIAWERIVSVATMDTGVWIYSYSHSNENKTGDDSPTLWLSTVQSTRMEFQGNSAVAGSLQIITCDIAPGEVQPSERFVETSATGFHPQVGASVAGAQ